MTSQDSISNLLEDNNINSFFDMSLLQQITPTTDLQLLITSLNDNVSDKLKYEEMLKLVKEHMIKIPIIELELTLLQYLLPAIKNLVLKILNDSTQIIENILEESKLKQLECLKQGLKLILDVLDLMSDIMCYILTNKTFQLVQIKSLPINVVAVLSSIFIHCKEKKDVYLSLGETGDIILLFKKTQDINMKLLEMFRINVTTDITSVLESSVLEEMLYLIGEIGQLLLDINLKASADNWIGYLNISQKFSKHLNSGFNNENVVKFFTNEILHNMQKLSDLDEKDLKSKQQIQKVIGLLTKLLNKFFEINALHSVNNKIATFIIKLFNFYKPTNTNNNVANVSKEFEFFTSMAIDAKLCVQLIADDRKEEYGFLIILIMMFRNLTKNAQNVPELDVAKYLDVVFQSFDQHALEMFYHSRLPNFSSQVYEELTINIASIVHLYGSSHYEDIADNLFNKLTGDSFYQSLLALDIWLLVLKLGPICLQFDTLCSIVRRNSFLKSNNSNLPKIIVLKAFLKKLYEMLREDYKMHIVETYPLSENLHIWRCIGLHGLPKCGVHMINGLVAQCVNYMKKFLNKDIDIATFLSMCQMWETLSTVEIINIHVKELYTPLIKLWEIHNWNEEIQCYSFYNYYLSCLFTVTNRFITSMCNYQIITVLKQIIRIMEMDRSNCTLEYVSRILDVLCNKAFSPQNLQEVLNSISEILNNLLNVDNIIIKQRSLELLHKYMTCSPHDEIVRKVAYSLDLQMMLANFYEKKNIIDDDLMKSYLENKLRNIFRHNCKDTIEVPKLKKYKLNESVCTILERIETDVKCLNEFSKCLTSDDRIKLNAIKNIFENI